MDRSAEVIIVTGMHRSGTSLCANLVSLLGVDMSDAIEPSVDNPSGHWERPDLVQLHERVLRLFGRGWHDPGHALNLPPDWESWPQVQAVKDEIVDWPDAELNGSRRRFGFKDPRAALLMQLWDQVCAELHVTPRHVFCVRHPAHVAGSLARRDGMSARDANYRWMVYDCRAVHSLGERPVCVIPYDEWFVDSSVPLADCRFWESTLPQQGPVVGDLVAQIVDPALRHDEPGAEPETVASALYRHLVESAPFDRFSVVAREASKAFMAVDEFMQPLLEAAYAERSPVEKQPVPPGSGVSYDMDMVHLAGRLAGDIELHMEALGSVLDKLKSRSRGGVGRLQPHDANATHKMLRRFPLWPSVLTGVHHQSFARYNSRRGPRVAKSCLNLPAPFFS